jgi:putative FmdB family regulatory protein
MPIFEYECPSCGNRFDKLIRGGASGEIACPKCGGSNTKRVMSVFASFNSSGGTGGSASFGGTCAPSGGG